MELSRQESAQLPKVLFIGPGAKEASEAFIGHDVFPERWGARDTIWSTEEFQLSDKSVVKLDCVIANPSSVPAYIGPLPNLLGNVKMIILGFPCTSEGIEKAKRLCGTITMHGVPIPLYLVLSDMDKIPSRAEMGTLASDQKAIREVVRFAEAENLLLL